ncbi:5-carboxymethyl-2-hydroxymuconate isomerase [Massilia sp. JS1662]|nr:fumarylacetoacetate hydrolase family protein [Massilia sp. JS1662]KGF80960.1 5-carboxymethyl-2-hydroxymuconate isomerase [Massilia sp. JS1662]
MKFASFRLDGKDTFGFLDGNVVVDLGNSGLGNDLREFIENGGLDKEPRPAAGAARVPLANVDFLPVITHPQKILCVGINYRSHVKETGRDVPTFPMIFTRFADSQTGHNQAIVRPHASSRLDFEGELAVVIGKKARHVQAADALDVVAGYSCYNDGSVRDWQRHSIQFIPGKNFPSTGGFGPWLVTRDEVGDPSELSLVTRLNGHVVQEAKTDDLIFPIPQLIEYCTTFTALNPGDVIITGTTGGVGAFREPPLWMRPGDVVEVEISRIGTLVNRIEQES